MNTRLGDDYEMPSRWVILKGLGPCRGWERETLTGVVVAQSRGRGNQQRDEISWRSRARKLCR